MTTPTRVLCTDAEAGDGWLADRLDRHVGIEATTASPPAVLTAVADGASGVDAVVCGQRLSGTWSGVELVRAVRERAPDLPVVLFTGYGSEATATAAIGAGVTDYVPRSRSDALGRVAETARESADTPAEARADPTDDGCIDDGTALRRLLVAANEEHTLADRLQAVLRVGSDRLDLPIGFLAHIDDEFDIVLARGDHEGLQAGDSAPVDSTYCARMLENGSSLAMHDVAERWGADDERLRKHGLLCYIGTEVSVHGDTYGTLCFGDTERRERRFSTEEQTLVNLLGRWAGYELAKRDRLAALERRNERLDDFAGIVSHDLRNPLAVATGHLEMARQGGVDAADDRPDGYHLERAEESLDRMSDVIERSLRLSRKGRDVDERSVPLSTLAERAWDRARTDEATLRCEDDIPLDSDPGLTVELLTNLFENAVKHGGATGVAVERIPDGFAVADDGEGLTPDQHDHLFNRGSTQGSGAGLGLHIVERVAAAQDWTVRLSDAAPDRGARFEIVETTPDRSGRFPGVVGMDSPATFETPDTDQPGAGSDSAADDD